MQPLPQPPRKDDRSFDDWMYRLWKRVLSAAGSVGVLWGDVDKTGSNLTDLETRNHADLQNINTAEYTHLTEDQAAELTGGENSTLHYHGSDRDSANFTGDDWAELTGGGYTELHYHAGGGTGEQKIYEPVVVAGFDTNVIYNDYLSAPAFVTSSNGDIMMAWGGKYAS